MNCGARAGASPHSIGGSRMVAVGEQNPGHAEIDNLLENVIGRLDGIDTEITLRVAKHIAIEVVTMRLGEPRPSEDAAHNFAHRLPPRQSRLKKSCRPSLSYSHLAMLLVVMAAAVFGVAEN